MAEEDRTLLEITEAIHGGYFLISVNGDRHRWRYRYQGDLIVTSNRTHKSMQKCVDEIKKMRTCATAPIYVAD